MKKCYCGRDIYTTLERHTQFHTEYCSQYCYHYYQNPEAYPDIRKSDSKYHINQWRKPNITVNCEMCGDEFSIRDDTRHNNTICCGRSCALQLKRGKKTFRDWRILKLISLYPNSTSQFLMQKWRDNNHSISSQSMGQILRLYTARNIINRKSVDGNIFSYQISEAFADTQLTLGQAVQNKVRL